MKILHLNTHDANGGAAIAARRLHDALNREKDVYSFLGVQHKTSDALDVLALPTEKNYFSKGLSLVNRAILKTLRTKGSVLYSHPFMPTQLFSAIKRIPPDIIHLHWIADNFLSFSDLHKIAALNIPIVWTLHDTWAFTGGCHYYGQCPKWINSCNACPMVHSSFLYDISQKDWSQKEKLYKILRPNIIGLSNYFRDNIKKSKLLHDFYVINLPNTIDCSVFRPFNKQEARNILNLAQDKKYILFGAMNSNSDFRKGFDLLQQALQAFSRNNDIECLIFGASHGGNNTNMPLPTNYLGILHDEISLALMYSAADVFVCPSREDNLPNTIMESIACGTPVAAFSVGGIPDMITHKLNGMLATPHDPNELAQGIAYILENKERWESMGKAARSIAEERYSMPVVAKQYIDLYERLLAK